MEVRRIHMIEDSCETDHHQHRKGPREDPGGHKRRRGPSSRHNIVWKDGYGTSRFLHENGF